MMKLQLCLSLVVCFAIGCSDKSKSPEGDQTSSAGTSTESNENNESKSFGDFSISIPPGWTVAKPDRDKTKAVLFLDGTNWRNAKAIIKIDVGPTLAPTADQLAEALAQNTNGKVSKEAVEFDGTPAVEVLTSSNDLMIPRNMFAIYRDGKAYLVMAAATAGIEVDDAISHVHKSWKWN